MTNPRILGERNSSSALPLPHGEEEGPLGYVILLAVRSGDMSFMYCPDVQGPMENSTLTYIISANPGIVVERGPPSYLSETKVPKESVARGLKNFKRLSRRTPLTLVDRQILRDERGMHEIRKISDFASSHGNRVVTYAEFLGREAMLLESSRPRLYQDFPPSLEFQRWAKLPPLQQRSRLPPV